MEAINQQIPAAEMERIMKVQEVILKAMAGSLKWWEAAEVIGVTDRTMRQWRERYQEHGYDGLYDHRKGQPSPPAISTRDPGVNTVLKSKPAGRTPTTLVALSFNIIDRPTAQWPPLGVYFQLPGNPELKPQE